MKRLFCPALYCIGIFVMSLASAVAQMPVIESVTAEALAPNTWPENAIPAKSEEQRIIIRGRGFTPGARVGLLDFLHEPHGPWFLDPLPSMSHDRQIVVSARFGTQESIWTLAVANGDVVSDPFFMSVIARRDGKEFQYARPVSIVDLRPVTEFGPPAGSTELGRLSIVKSFGRDGYPFVRLNNSDDRNKEANEWLSYTAFNNNRNISVTGPDAEFSWRTGATEIYNRTNSQEHHSGEDWNRIDIATDEGESVFAIGDGIVLFRGCLDNYGHTVIILHKLLSGEVVASFYAHMRHEDMPLIKAGNRVRKGDTIGHIAHTKEHRCSIDGGAPHLHFEIWRESMLWQSSRVRSDLPNLVMPRNVLRMWPPVHPESLARGDGGESFIRANYYNPSMFIAYQGNTNLMPADGGYRDWNGRDYFPASAPVPRGVNPSTHVVDVPTAGTTIAGDLNHGLTGQSDSMGGGDAGDIMSESLTTTTPTAVGSPTVGGSAPTTIADPVYYMNLTIARGMDPNEWWSFGPFESEGQAGGVGGRGTKPL